jgi:hypothetical protein
MCIFEQTYFRGSRNCDCVLKEGPDTGFPVVHCSSGSAARGNRCATPCGGSFCERSVFVLIEAKRTSHWTFVNLLDFLDTLGEEHMPFSTSLGIAIFLLGAAVGALLTRLRWHAFKQVVLREIMEQREYAAEPWPRSQKSLQVKFRKTRNS